MQESARPGETLATDVVVVGGGFAGLAAALEAAEHGAKVTVLIRTGLLANCSAMSGAGVALVNTPLQRQLGIEDSPELFAHDLARANACGVDAGLVDAAAQGAAQLHDWLTGFGANFHALIRWSGHSVLRVHYEIGDLDTGISGHGQGGRLIRLLHEAAKARGVDVRLGTAATSLTTDEAGAVIGVKARDKQGLVTEIKAKRGVVLAAGGFAKNKEMLQKYAPGLADWRVLSGAGSTGDGVTMGMAIGAQAVNMDTVLMVYGVRAPNGRATQRLGDALRAALHEGIAVNWDGRRFMDETVSYSRGTSQIMRQRNRTAFVVFDEQTRDTLGLTAEDEVTAAATPAELAAQLSIDQRTLAETVASYNEAVLRIYNWGFPAQRRPLLGRLFSFAFSGNIVGTHGGLKINHLAQVIHQRGDPIPGLWAAGDNAAGLGGPSQGHHATPGYLSGCGNGGALAYGRIAGRNAARRNCG